MSLSRAAPEAPVPRALVLSGGGPVGRAWQWGLAAGCLQAGIDWREAGRIVGTSAGAMVGARLGLGHDPRQSRPVVDTAAGPPGTAAAFGQLALLLAKAVKSATPQAVWQQIGQLALTAPVMDEAASLARPSFAPFLEQPFPDILWATAVGTLDGQLQVWTSADGVSLPLAIASSAALPGVWPPISIGAQRYMDGGVRSMLNADLAAGCRAVIVVSCFDLSTGPTVSTAIRARNQALQAEIAALRASGATVEVVAPDAAFNALTQQGTQMLNSALVPQAYEVGLRQAAAESGRLKAVWSA